MPDLAHQPLPTAEEAARAVPKNESRFSIDGEELARWHRQLSVQERYFRRMDLALMQSLPAWKRAERVLEAGCGNGAFVRSLALHNPEKEFVAVDYSRAFLDVARDRNAMPNVEYRLADACNMSPAEWGQFDFVVARFLVQHLPSLPEFLDCCRRLLRPGGTLLIYDAYDQRVYLEPEAPERVALFDLLARQQDREGVGREAIERARSLSRRYGFVQSAIKPLIHPAVTSTDKALLRDLITGMMECMQLGLDVGKGRAALERWADDPTSYGQFATRALLLRNRGTGSFPHR